MRLAPLAPPDERRRHVEALRALVSAGRYDISAEPVAEAVVASVFGVEKDTSPDGDSPDR